MGKTPTFPCHVPSFRFFRERLFYQNKTMGRVFMNFKRIVTFSAAAFLTTTVAQAAHIWEDPNAWWCPEPDAPRYNANELDLDLFGSYFHREGEFNDLFSTDINHGFWGGGAGITYYFLRNLGLGADFNASSKPDDLGIFDYTTGNIYFRIPICNSGFAPYIFGGGGRAVAPAWYWVYGAGVGLEYRIRPAIGIFSDARFLWNDRSTELNTLTIRAGLRIAF
jgi:hypothetical protein